MNEVCAAKMEKQPTIDEKLEKLLGIINSSRDQADLIYGKLFRDGDGIGLTQDAATPTDCVESKINRAGEMANITLKLLTEIREKL